MEILVEEHLLALRVRQHEQHVERRVDEPSLERPTGPLPSSSEPVGPPGCLLGQRSEWGPRGHPKARQEPNQHVEGTLRLLSGQRCPRVAPLEEEGVHCLLYTSDAADDLLC